MQPRLELRTKQATQRDPWDRDNLESLGHLFFYNFVELNSVKLKKFGCLWVTIDNLTIEICAKPKDMCSM